MYILSKALSMPFMTDPRRHGRILRPSLPNSRHVRHTGIRSHCNHVRLLEARHRIYGDVSFLLLGWQCRNASRRQGNKRTFRLRRMHRQHRLSSARDSVGKAAIFINKLALRWKDVRKISRRVNKAGTFDQLSSIRDSANP